MRGTVETWVNSQCKYQAAPGQFSVAINNWERLEAPHPGPRPSCLSLSRLRRPRLNPDLPCGLHSGDHARILSSFDSTCFQTLKPPKQTCRRFDSFQGEEALRGGKTTVQVRRRLQASSELAPNRNNQSTDQGDFKLSGVFSNRMEGRTFLLRQARKCPCSIRECQSSIC
jgi:hypothetical protein